MHLGSAVHDPVDLIAGAGQFGGGHVLDNGSRAARVHHKRGIGQVTSAADGGFVVHPGPGQVNVQILKPGDGAGMATGSFSS